jgi:tetratricopeptide (TPR) repeat protein
MKTMLSILLFLFGLSTVFGQQTDKADDALLLEYYQNQRFADAANYLKKIYPEPVSDIKTLSSLAYASQMAGRLLDAENYYQRIYTADTTNTAVLFNLGSVNARRGNNNRALLFYGKVLQRDSSNFNMYKQMASLSQNTGNIPDAIRYFQKANQLNPSEPDVAYDLSAFYLNLKLYTKADTVITLALKTDTANLLLLLAKAQTDYRLKKFPETVAICNKLIGAGERASTIISMLGTSFYELKKYNDCITTFKMLEQSLTASETSYYYTAMSYKALGNNTTAIAYFEKAIKEAVSANANTYYGEVADSYDQLHQLKNAVNAYQKSFLYGDHKPLIYYSLANLYDTELKNKVLALKYYKKYLGSKPSVDEKAYIAYSKRRISELHH